MAYKSVQRKREARLKKIIIVGEGPGTAFLASIMALGIIFTAWHIMVFDMSASAQGLDSLITNDELHSAFSQWWPMQGWTLGAIIAVVVSLFQSAFIIGNQTSPGKIDLVESMFVLIVLFNFGTTWITVTKGGKEGSPLVIAGWLLGSVAVSAFISIGPEFCIAWSLRTFLGNAPKLIPGLTGFINWIKDAWSVEVDDEAEQYRPQQKSQYSYSQYPGDEELMYDVPARPAAGGNRQQAKSTRNSGHAQQTSKHR